MTKKNPGSRGRGRPPGVPNRVTASVKASLETAFEAIGGIERLTEWAQENPTDFYKLYAKLLPIDLRANVQHAGVVKIVVETGITRSPNDPVPEAEPC